MPSVRGVLDPSPRRVQRPRPTISPPRWRHSQSTHARRAEWSGEKLENGEFLNYSKDVSRIANGFDA